MKGQLSTPEQRGNFIVMHAYKYEEGLNHLGQAVIKRRLKCMPGIGQEVLARGGKRKYIVGPRGNLIRQRGLVVVGVQ